MAQPPIRCSLRHEVGYLLEVDMEPHRLVSELKSKVEREWQFPAATQAMTCDAVALSDEDRLDAHCKPGATLVVQIAINLDGVERDLEKGSCFEKLAALKALYELALIRGQGDEQAITVIVPQLDDDEADVRRAAVNALGQMAEVGDSEAIALLAASLEDSDEHVRAAAIAALPKLAERGSEHALAVVSQRLKHSQPEVRHSSLLALLEVAAWGSEDAVFALGECLEDPERKIRDGAIEALSKIARPGDGYSFFTVGSRLEHPDADVRASAVTALGKVAARGDEAAIAAICSRFEDVDARVRDNAVVALAEASPGVGDEEVIDAVLRRLREGKPDARCAALQALPLVSVKGAADVAKAVLAAVEDPDGKVRRLAASVLSELGDESLVGELGQALEHLDADVRCSALNALSKVARQGDEAAMSALRERAEDPDARVRYKTLEVLPKLARPGDTAAIDLVTELLGDSDKHVLSAAVATLAKVSDKSNFPFAAVSARLEHPDATVRRAAAKALSSVKVSEESDESITASQA